MEGLLVLLLAGVSFVAAIGSLIVASAGRGWVHRGASWGIPAQQVLDQRLARGEIEVQDYISRSAALRGEWANGMEYRPSEPSDDEPPADPSLVPIGARRPAPNTMTQTTTHRSRPAILPDRPLIHVMPGLIEPPPGYYRG